MTKDLDKCCFCGTFYGALVQLHQGWCCLKCFKTLLDEPIRFCKSSQVIKKEVKE